MSLPIGRQGRIRSGKYAGWTAEIEEDAKIPGAWHIWIIPPADESTEESQGWDIWADDKSQLLEWLSDPEFDIDWG